jgi:hypothetical protein
MKSPFVHRSQKHTERAHLQLPRTHIFNVLPDEKGDYLPEDDGKAKTMSYYESAFVQHT